MSTNATLYVFMIGDWIVLPVDSQVVQCYSVDRFYTFISAMTLTRQPGERREYSKRAAKSHEGLFNMQSGFERVPRRSNTRSIPSRAGYAGSHSSRGGEIGAYAVCS